PGLSLKPEMFITAAVELNEVSSGISVPATALFTEDGKSYLFVAAGDRRFERRMVEAASDGEGRWRVTSGLQAGGRVVTTGERLRGVNLPDKADVQLAPLSTPIGELFRYRLNGKGVDLRELRSTQDWVVARYLKLAPGVADVVSLGGFLKQYQVNLDLPKLKSYNIPMQQILSSSGQG